MDYALSKIFYDKVIPQFIKRRNELGYTQSSLDYDMNIARGLISKWEVGIRNPSGFLFCCWAEALDCHIVLVPKKVPKKKKEAVEEMSVAKLKKRNFKWR